MTESPTAEEGPPGHRPMNADGEIMAMTKGTGASPRLELLLTFGLISGSTGAHTETLDDAHLVPEIDEVIAADLLHHVPDAETTRHAQTAVLPENLVQSKVYHTSPSYVLRPDTPKITD